MEIETLAALPSVNRAREALRRDTRRILRDQIEVARIPAPPFGESRRAEWFAARLREAGVADVDIDEVGNVVGELPGRSVDRRAPVIIAAHLDTVFAAGTPIEPRHDGDRWIAPGIADNARGLAVTVALARSLGFGGLATERPLFLVGTVGEEAEGDLRGVKHLFREGSPLRRAAAFIALDGAGLNRVIHRALGVCRFRFTVTGPGGHSWADWGRPNPIHALGRAIAALVSLDPSPYPRATLSVGRIVGGTRVNAIADEAWFEVDLRSGEAGVLDALADRARAVVDAEVERENAERMAATTPLTLEVRTIGDRPTGETPPDAPLVRAAIDATRLVDARPELSESSTDANVPIALGVPAIALGAGGEAGETHTNGEWFADLHHAAGAERALLVALAASGVARRRTRSKPGPATRRR